MWRMACQCDCEHPQHLPAHVVGDDPIYEASVIWLSQQTRTILSMDTPMPDVSLMAKLRLALTSSGFAPRSISRCAGRRGG